MSSIFTNRFFQTSIATMIIILAFFAGRTTSNNQESQMNSEVQSSVTQDNNPVETLEVQNGSVDINNSSQEQE
tara:strand:- start:799 stop:1017 length:219 start_codon:yes stop_codon:yes gene_type:complete